MDRRRRRGSTALILVLLLAVLTSCVPVQTSTSRGAPARAANESHLLVITPSADQTGAFTSTPVTIAGFHQLIIEIDVTAVGGTTPTLDVKIQELIDGTNWCDTAAFTQITTSPKRQIIRLSAVTTPQAEVACTDATLAAGTIHQGPFGSQIRIKHGAPGGTASPHFTYSVTAWASE